MCNKFGINAVHLFRNEVFWGHHKKDDNFQYSEELKAIIRLLLSTHDLSYHIQILDVNNLCG